MLSFHQNHEKTHVKCLVCKGTTETFITVSAELSYSFYKCSECSTLTSNPLPPPNIVSYGDSNSAQWKHYIDIGAGIDSMVGALGERKNEKLLDIGCGFGFTTHYWASENQSLAIGVDESEMAKQGSQQLGWKLVEPRDLHNLSFQPDIIFASEVIEHVVDPQQFLVDMYSLLQPSSPDKSGALILTTPNADFVIEGAEETKVIAALSPGFHTCLLTKSVVVEMAKKLIPEPDEIWIQEASDRLFIFIGLGSMGSTRFFNFNKSLSINYLEKLSNHENARVAAGANFRLLDFYVNEGAWARAEPKYLSLLRYLESTFGIHKPFEVEILERFSEIVEKKDFELYLNNFPGWFSSFVFYSSQIFRNQNRPGQQVFALEMAEKLFETEILTFPAFSQMQESLLRVIPARMTEAGEFLIFRYGKYGVGMKRASKTTIKFIWKKFLRSLIVRVKKFLSQA